MLIMARYEGIHKKEQTKSLRKKQCVILLLWVVLFENRPALYFCNYIFIIAHKLYNFGFRIKDTVFFLLTIMIIIILIMKILLHNEYKIINLWYPTYVYQFFNFPCNYKNRVLACFQTRPASMSSSTKRYSFILEFRFCIYCKVAINNRII